MFTRIKLQQVCTIFSGNSINSDEKESKYTNSPTGTPYVATKDVGFEGMIDYFNGVNIPYDSLNLFKIAPSEATLVCAEGGSAGRKIAITDRKICFVNKLFALCPGDDLHPRYLFYFTRGQEFQRQFKASLTGIIGGVSLSKIKNFDISFPSREEQQRIVAILDQTFTDIDKVRANTEKNLKNARELFNSYLNQMFSQLGEGCVEKKLDDVLLSNPRNGWSPPANNHAEEGTPVLTLSAVTGFEFKSSMIKYTSAPTKKGASYWVSDGDLLMTRSNTSRLVGHVAIAYGITSPTIYPDIIIKLNLDNSLVDSKFMYYQLRSPKLRKIISTSAHGANPTMKKLNQGMIKSFPINIASINQQKKVAGLLDDYYTETKQMETLYREKIKKLEELKKSLLQKAFSGELTKTEGHAA